MRFPCLVSGHSVVRGGLIAPASISLLALLFGGCSASPENAQGGPWAQDVLALGRSTKVDSVKTIALDGQISAGEFNEVEQGFMECLADLGYKARIDIDSLGVKMYVIEGDWSDKKEIDYSSCGRETGLMELSPLYDSITTNPYREDFNALILECLQKLGAVDSDTSIEAFVEIQESGQLILSEDEAKSAMCYSDPRPVIEEARSSLDP